MNEDFIPFEPHVPSDRDEWKSRAENAESLLAGFKAVTDQIIDIVSPETGSHENIVVAVRRLIKERDDWKEAADALLEAADALLKCATEGATCDKWNAAFAMHLAASERKIRV